MTARHLLGAVLGDRRLQLAYETDAEFHAAVDMILGAMPAFLHVMLDQHERAKRDASWARQVEHDNLGYICQCGHPSMRHARVETDEGVEYVCQAAAAGALGCGCNDLAPLDPTVRHAPR